MSIIGTIQMICVPPLLKWAGCNLEENAQLKCIQDAKSALYYIILHYITIHCSKLKFTQDGKSTGSLHHFTLCHISLNYNLLHWIKMHPGCKLQCTTLRTPGMHCTKLKCTRDAKSTGSMYFITPSRIMHWGEVLCSEKCTDGEHNTQCSAVKSAQQCRGEHNTQCSSAQRDADNTHSSVVSLFWCGAPHCSCCGPKCRIIHKISCNLTKPFLLLCPKIHFWLSFLFGDGHECDQQFNCF